MRNLYEDIKKAKEKDELAILSVINRFEPKIKFSLRQTSLQNREDLSQELKIKIIEALNRCNLEEVPNFKGFCYYEQNKKYRKIN